MFRRIRYEVMRPFRWLFLALLSAALMQQTLAQADIPVPRDKPDPPSANQNPVREAYRSAFDRARKGDSTAVDALPADADPLARDLIDWLLLTKGAKADFSDYRAFIEDHSGWPLLSTLRRKAESAIDSSVPDRDIIDWFGRYPPLSGIGHIRHAETLAATGEQEQAALALRAGWRVADLSISEERALLRRHGDLLTAADHKARVDYLLWNRRRADAARLYSLLDPDLTALAKARSGLIGFAYNVDALVAAVPARLEGQAGLVLDRSTWRRVKGKNEGAETLLLESRVDGVDILRPDRWWQERHFQARRALREGRMEDAYRLAAEHAMLSRAESETEGAEDDASALPLTTRAQIAEAEWLAGWIALRFLDRPADALEHFHRMLSVVSLPTSLARGAYWSARAADALGDEPLARRWYQAAGRHATVFYGQLAMERLGDRISERKGALTLVSDEARARFEARPLVRAIRFLAAIGEEKSLSYFARQLALSMQSEAENRLAAELGASLERPHVGVIAVKVALNGGAPILDGGYPVVRIKESPHERESLILAIARQESQFDPAAVSHVGAMGLMQLMPATAQRLSRRLNHRYSRERLLTDPAFNLELGSTYFADLLRRYDNSPILALAAYNAGPGPVDRWLGDYGDPRNGDIDPLDWIELVPYGETRNYIQRVMEAAPVYSMRLEGKDAPLALSDYIGLGRKGGVGKPGL